MHHLLQRQATARPDNGSASVLDALMIPERELLEGEERNKWGSARRYFEVTVDALAEVITNTKNRLQI